MSRIWKSHMTHMNSQVQRWSVDTGQRLQTRRIVKVKGEREDLRVPRVISHTRISNVTHVKESHDIHECSRSHIWKSNMTHLNEQCHAYERVTSHTCTRNVIRMKRSHDTHEWTMSHMWKSHTTTHMNEKYLAYETVVLQTWMSHITHRKESSHTWMSNVTHMKESRHTHERDLSCVLKSHLTRVNEQCHASERVTWHRRPRKVTREGWLTGWFRSCI